MASGCKCPGSCACKIKKPRKPKMKKAVLGGRVKQPQVVIQGMPAVSTTAIPAGYPYLTVTSDADLKPKAKAVETQTEVMAQPEIKEEKQEPLRELKGDSLFLSLPTKTPSQQLSLLKSKIAAGTTKQFPVIRATTGTQAGPSLTTTEVQTEAPTRMTTEAQTNLIEYVGAGTQFGPSLKTAMTQTSMKVRSPAEIAAIAKEQKEAGIVEGFKMGRAREAALRTKETKEMGTETEPLLVTVAKGAKQDVFALMKEQEATGKVLSLTGAGRPARSFNESVALATPSPSPVRAAPAPVVAPAPVAAPAPAAAPAPSAVAAALNAFGPGRSTPSMQSFFKKEPSAVAAAVDAFGFKKKEPKLE
jgi:hypothetical protein